MPKPNLQTPWVRALLLALEFIGLVDALFVAASWATAALHTAKGATISPKTSLLARGITLGF
jgi:hypothetical protein